MTRPSPSHGPDRPALLRDVVRWAPLVSAVAGLAGGGLAFASGRPDVAAWIWTTGTVPVLLLLAREIVVRLRNGDVGLDLVAALAMASALAVGEFLAAAVVALMFAGGQGLEAFAKGRASRDMTALLDKAPRSANRYEHATLATIAADDVEVGDRLLVRLGERLPVDGIVSGSPALVDQAAMTGESLPVTRQPGETAMSGSTTVGPAFDLTATRKAADSTYAGIVRLVEEASRSQAPMVRLADRYALGFTLATLVVSGLAWVLAGDPVRAVAVLVVATPCPLILAVPVAIVAGISRAARLGVLVKGGTALETLG